MAIDFTYGIQTRDNYLAAGERVADSVNNGRFWEVSKQINRSFFGGGVLKPKRFNRLASINKPVQPLATHHDVATNSITVNVGKKTSFSAVAGYFECLPSVGPIFAAVNALFHTVGMFYSYSKLKKAVVVLNAVERNEFNIGRGEVSVKTNAVFTAAVKFTMHQNHMVGSMLALVPLLKPITRIAQGTIFHIKEEVKARANRQEVDPSPANTSESVELI